MQADTDFFVRAADNNNIPSIKNVVFSVLKEYGLKPDSSGIDKDLEDAQGNYYYKNGFFGVVLNNAAKEIVGTFGLYQINKNVCELRKMYLMKNARGIGLGNLMLTKAIETAKEMNYKKIVLETISPLKEAISLYKKFGFTPVSPHKINYRVDQAFELNIT